MSQIYCIAGISRAPIYSPNSVDKDGAIFLAVLQCLEGMGHQVKVYQESDLLTDEVQEKYIFNMVRTPEAVAKLQSLETMGVVSVNSGFGIANCSRAIMTTLLLNKGVASPKSQIIDFETGKTIFLPNKTIDGKPLSPLVTPTDHPSTVSAPCWVKRADGYTTQVNDVLFVAQASQLPSTLEDFRSRGIKRVVVSEHLQGDLIKFYGVVGTSFFHWFYPSVSHHSKFGYETINGSPTGISFEVTRLQTLCSQAASALGVDVYGGDAIVASDGSMRIIDFNDWPSFAPCRDEASQAIAQIIIHKIQEEEL
ncbi:MAG: hypothetical protein K5856_03745 [Bacteroidaceae bacterium]|nr:hypothetical protein [Bacteroidaceae bacterium]